MMTKPQSMGWLGLIAGGILTGSNVAAFDLLQREQNPVSTLVVTVHDPQATDAFAPQFDRVRQMVRRGLTNITGQSTLADAWRSLVSTQDIIGLKVYSAPGPNGGTRPAVVAAVVESLIAAGVPSRNLVLWDKELADLRQAGFMDLAREYRIRIAGSANAGYASNVFYYPDIPMVGPLIWRDLEYGDSTEGSGRKSYVSKLVATELTKIVNISPLLNHYGAGVAGNLYGLSMASVDNTYRFEKNPAYLAQAVPEIYALPQVGDKVVLNIVDALICQYQGQQAGMLHYATVLNELRFSKDPVALDALSLADLAEQRRLTNTTSPPVSKELFENATLLQLGVCQPAKIMVERFEF